MTAELAGAMYSLTKGTAPEQMKKAGPVTVRSASSPVAARQVGSDKGSLRTIEGVRV